MGQIERPFLFCRYQIHSENERLDSRAELTLLQELQGQLIWHRTKEAEGNGDTVLIEPEEHECEGYTYFTWSVGQLQGQKFKPHYNQVKEKIEFNFVDDGSIRFSEFVAIPKLGVFAVDDRGGENHLGGKQAINRFKTIIRSEDGMDVDIFFEASRDEVQKALKSWSLTKFNFTIRPNNPRPVSRLAQQLSEQMKNDGIGRLNARAVPYSSGEMQMSDTGLIRAVTDLSEAGYGQYALAGYTEDGIRAEIKKPIYSEDRQKNETASDKPRELRVFINSDDIINAEIHSTVALSLIKFHT